MKLLLDAVEYDQLFLSNKQLKNINYFWIGFIIYSVAFCCLASMGANIIYAILQSLSLILLFPTTYNLINFNIKNKYLKFLYVFYYCWLIIIFSRGFLFEKQFLIHMLYNAWSGILLYFVPLILIFPINIRFLKKVFDVIILLGIIYLIYNIIYIKLLLSPNPANLIESIGFIEYFSQTLSIPCAFIILTYSYHPKKRNLLALFVIVVTFLIAAIFARRGLMFMTICPLFISYILILLKNKRNILVILFLVVIGFFIFYIALNIYYENRKGLFSLITERIYEDTRTGGIEYFYSDMKTQDWIIGKGINGKYYGPGIDNTNNTNFRSVIEVGYLQIILNGGIVSLGLLVLITIPAAIKGIFYSKNMLSKASGLWILLWIMNSYPTIVTIFTLYYILVWIAVAVCYNRNLRNMSENDVKLLFSQAYKLPL